MLKQRKSSNCRFKQLIQVVLQLAALKMSRMQLYSASGTLGFLLILSFREGIDWQLFWLSVDHPI